MNITVDGSHCFKRIKLHKNVKIHLKIDNS